MILAFFICFTRLKQKKLKHWSEIVKKVLDKCFRRYYNDTSALITVS